MKKILLVAILVGIPIFICSNEDLNYTNYEKRFPNLPKDHNWEYVISRLYPNKVINSNIGRFEGPILIDLHQASVQDSLIIDDVINDLRALLPKKEIDFLTSFIQNYDEKITKEILPKNYNLNDLKEYSIKLSFDSIHPSLRQKYTHITKIEDKIKISNSRQSYQYFSNTRDHINGITNQYINFEFSNSVSIQEKKRIIYYKLLRALVYDVNTYPNNKHGIAVFTRNSTSTKYQLTEMDVFLLQKLYSNDFVSQLRSYMISTYPLNYAMNFMSESDAKFIGLISVLLIGLISLVLIGFILAEIDFTHIFFNYLLTTLLIGFLFMNLLLLYNYFVEPSKFINVNDILNLHFYGSVYLFIISFLFWFIEKKIFSNQINFLQFLGVKILVTLFVLNFPTVVFFVLKYLFDIQLFDNEKTELYLTSSLLFISVFVVIIRSIILYIDFQSKSLINKKDVELSRLREINTKSELKSLQSHINPHFLYNALNSIASLVHTSPDKSEKMVLSLSNLFRYSINKKGKQMSTIAEEVVMVQNYLAIESERFGERLQVSINVAKEIEKEEIPMFILQPLVENAIKHGVSKIRKRGEIVLKIEKEKNTIVISVYDNGPDFPEGLVSGYGLQMVYDLLRLSYGDKASVSWQNTPKKQISIVIEKN